MSWFEIAGIIAGIVSGIIALFGALGTVFALFSKFPGLETSVKTLSADVAEMKEDSKTNQKDLVELRECQSSMEGKLDVIWTFVLRRGVGKAVQQGLAQFVSEPSEDEQS